jgi:tetratricopeptide (TPR) repeat protein
MGIFGKNPQDYEHRGDKYIIAGAAGKAKIEYETALARLEKKSPEDAESRRRLENKIRRSKESLAVEHKKSADNLMAAGWHEDARELYDLTLELTENPELSAAVRQCLEAVESNAAEKGLAELPDPIPPGEQIIQTGSRENGDEYFTVLCSTLPENIRKAYLGYGTAFKRGFLALNQGDFELAEEQLSLAWRENPSSDSFIPLELATAYLNLEKYEEARRLLKAFVKHHPDVLPGYQLLCEIFWETEALEDAMHLLSSIPDELKESVAVYLLRGETLFRAQKYLEAKTLYLDFINAYGWHEQIARSLAQTIEALGEIKNAQRLYGEILSHYQSCGSRTDPAIKRKYADLSLAAGQYSTKTLELYFSLVQEDVVHAGEYYQKISRIYAALGNPAQARRFQLFADQLREKE